MVVLNEEKIKAFKIDDQKSIETFFAHTYRLSAYEIFKKY